ncbi:MAG: GAF domain-containing protein [Acidobacteria bacterium]|nr:GAF domain-containing protein [Acidobacteriota bacterium]
MVSIVVLHPPDLDLSGMEGSKNVQRTTTLDESRLNGAQLVAVIRGKPPARLPDDAVIVQVGNGPAESFITLPEDSSPDVIQSAVRSAVRAAADRQRTRELEKKLAARTAELEEINEVGMALSTERDHDVLLDMILRKTREVTRSDAGSLYLLDQVADGESVLRWKVAQNDSLEVDFDEQILPVTKKSVAGFVALTGETLVIDDAYEIPEDVEYGFNFSFDKATGYRTKSMLVVPMKNQKNEITGILQLINHRLPDAPRSPLNADNVDARVEEYGPHTISVARSLAGQAAVAVENNLLYDSIERLFEGFVTAAVTAIEQRDPTTSGHSFRVADLTVGLAQVLDRVETGRFREIRFTPEQVKEIRYASLLHDFGKVGVREQVLVKQKKLYPMHLDLIRSRFHYLVKSTEAEVLRRHFEAICKGKKVVDEAMLEQLDAELKSEIDELLQYYESVASSNEPTVLPEGNFEILQQIGSRELVDPLGQRQTLLSPEEVRVLSIRKGSLDNDERKEIESHVTHTFHFLSKIPWTRELSRVPEYAYGHHEKVNGRGYPRGLEGESIPIQSRMMTVSDIYDALTAKDRPYKKAIPTERALDILNMEVKDGLLDEDVVDLFVEAKVYEKGTLRH